jgi:hypothetical protein
LLIWFEDVIFAIAWCVPVAPVAAYVGVHLLKATFKKPPSIHVLRHRALSVLLVINVLVLVTSFCVPYCLESTSVENVGTRFEQCGMMPAIASAFPNGSSQYVLSLDLEDRLILLDCDQEFDLNNLFPHFTVVTAWSPCAGFAMSCESILPADVSSVAAFTPAHSDVTDAAHRARTTVAIPDHAASIGTCVRGTPYKHETLRSASALSAVVMRYGVMADILRPSA